MTNDDGKERSAFLPGFRCKVYNPKMFGDERAYYFANNAKTVLEPADAIHTIAMQSPEYKAGKMPLVKVMGVNAVKIEGPRGSNTYYAPAFMIGGWYDRPECFGPRTVALPGDPIIPAETHAPAHKGAPAGTNGGPPSGHPASDDPWGSPPPTASHLPPPNDDLNDDIPF